MFRPNASLVWRFGSYDQPDLQLNGVDDFGVEWAVEPIQGWRTTAVEVPSEALPGDGARPGPGRFLERVLTLRGAFRAAGYNVDLEAAEDRLRDALEHVREDQTLSVTDTVPKQVSFRLSGDLTVDVRSKRIRTFTCVLTCYDPLKYAAGVSGLVTAEFALRSRADAGGVQFPVRMPMRFIGGRVDPSAKQITNPGRVPIRPLLEFDGYVSGPRLIHMQSQSFYGVLGALAGGITARADLDAGTLTVDNQSRLSRRYPGSSRFALTKGRNDLQFIADSYTPGAKARLIYRPAWR